MTIICALHVPKKGTWIGADSRVSSRSFVYPMPARKIARIGARALLVCGSGMTMTLVKRHQARLLAKDDPDAVAMALMQMQERAKYRLDKDDASALSYGQVFIYATPKGVWDIDSAGAWLAVEPGKLWARGNGIDFALGYDLAVRQRGGIPERDRIHGALFAATTYDLSCGEPFVIEHLK